MTRSSSAITAGLLALCMLAACSGSDANKGIEATALKTRSPNSGPRFRLIDPQDSGLQFQNELSKAHNMPYIYNGAGCAAGDFDDDGLCDIYLVSQDGPNKLFRQTSPLKFEDVTARAGVDGGAAWGSGCSFVDVDGDADLDLYVCNTEAPNLLYINNGDGTFTNRAKELGLAHVGASTAPAFADIDNDGDIDLYLVTNRVLSPTMPQALLRDITPPADTEKTVADFAPTTGYLRRKKAEGSDLFKDSYFQLDEDHIYAAGQRDRLFANDGTGHFRDITKTSGLDDQAMGLSATWWDYDNDGLLDLYVANDLESPDQLYHNLGRGKFEEVSKSSLPQTAYFGMGSDSADINNDGRLDLMVADMSSTTHYKGKMIMGEMDKRSWFLSNSRPPQIMRNALFLNTGTNRFMEIGRLAGVASTDWTWAIKFADLDEDGFVDLYVTNGIPRFDNNPDVNPRFRSLLKAGKNSEALELARNVPPVKEKNLAFRNDGTLHFEKVAAAWGLDHEGVSHGAVYADLDRDGDLDLIVNNLNETVSLYENTTHDSHRILIRLKGSMKGGGSNSWGLGSRVTIAIADQIQTRILSLGHGYLSADEPMLHFGTGNTTTIDKLTVTWPSGHEQQFTDLAADQLYTITEPVKGEKPTQSDAERRAKKRLDPTLPERFFDDVGHSYTNGHSHRETAFDDYAAQPLLPQKHSQLGPGTAAADVNGDGFEDFFVGGARGQLGTLWLGKAKGGFTYTEGVWANEIDCEDMGMVWFDLEGDGDLDLYIVSGSVEKPAGHAHLRDRLYINDGKGSFTKSDAHPQIADSGSCVCAADFDRDGDVDLFVGGRIIAGRYPEAPPSHLLRNDNGILVEATADIATGLETSGLVTSAMWTDVDNDGWLDLMVTANWSAIRLWRNKSGKLIEDTQAGLAAHTGWWNGIGCGDLDGDGDLDYVVTNLGKNTKYKASPEHPAQTFYADFDNNGVLDIIEAKFEGDILLPVRGRSCSSNAIPELGERFPTFDQFARSTLKEIYTSDALDKAQNLKATTNSSSMLINDGKGHFEVRPLPHLAQVAPSFGVTINDFDLDGDLDIVLAQNFYQPEPETGRMAGGLSMMLHNRGDLKFEMMEPSQSGIIIPQAATGAITTELNHDGAPDLIIPTNDGPLKIYLTLTNRWQNASSIRLVDRSGDRSAIGARITVQQDGKTFVREIHAGGSYLSQDSALSFFGLDPNKPKTLSVRWPDGETSEYPFTDKRLIITR